MEDATSSKRRPGRPAKYDWSDKKDLCYRLYVEEQKSGNEIAQYFVERLHVPPEDLPGRRSFLRQFAIWGFTPHRKKLSPEDKVAAAARIKELWEQNINQTDIRATLEEEGLSLSRNEFYKIWNKDGLSLRSDAGFKALGEEREKKKRKRRSNVAVDPFMAELEAAAALDEPDTTTHNADDTAAPIDPEQEMMLMQRMNEIQRESDERLQKGKRRRRIRGYSHFPPDYEQSEPRYVSETTLDESKAFLHLTNEHYITIRKDYQTICEQMGIIKKTECADGVWEESKQRLIRENMHLSAMMHPLQPEQERKATGLDLICMDVTKRMRVADKAVTIAEANNILGLNPRESKAIRRSLYEIFLAVNFQSRLVSGEEQFQGLRQRWYNENEKLRDALAEGVPKKSRCIDLLCRDTMKRYQGDMVKKGVKLLGRQNPANGPGPGPAWAAPAARSKKAISAKSFRSAGKQVTQRPSGPPREVASSSLNHDDFHFDLDPALAASLAQPPVQTPAQTIAAYFRLASGSHIIGHHPKLWLGQLTSPATMESLIAGARSKAGAATVSTISGIVKNVDGTEGSWVIESTDELEVYLSEAGEKPTFSVVLVGGYA